MLYFGLLATRIDSTALIRASFALAILYYGALSCVSAAWHIYPLQLLSAAIVAVNGGIAITFFQNKLPGKLGTATNLYSTAQRVGTTVGYLAFGAVSSGFGHRGAYVACTMLVTSAFALSLLLERGTRALGAG
jgi:SET family sugar efflux transporter-like MFS transporter